MVTYARLLDGYYFLFLNNNEFETFIVRYPLVTKSELFLQKVKAAAIEISILDGDPLHSNCG